MSDSPDVRTNDVPAVAAAQPADADATRGSENPTDAPDKTHPSAPPSLGGEPVVGRPGGWLARGWRWCQRHPAVALLAVALGVLVALGGWLLVVRTKGPVLTKGPLILTLQGHTGTVTSVAFSPDGQRLASGSARFDPKSDKYWGEVKVWDAQTGQLALTLKGHTGSVRSVAFSADGKRIASGSGGLDPKTNKDWGEVTVWDAQTGQLALSFKGHTWGGDSMAFSPDGKRLASAGIRDKTVKVWDAQTGQQTLTLQGHTLFVSSVAFSPDGKRLASGSEDWRVKVWDAQTGQEALTLFGHTNIVTSVAFSPDGKRLASASLDGTVKVWDAQTGQETLTLQGHTSAVLSVAFSPDGQRLASGSWDNTVRVWDAQTGQQQLSLKGHTNSVTSVAFSPDGKRLASGSLDLTVKVWDTTLRKSP